MTLYPARRITGAALENGKVTVIQSLRIKDRWRIEKGFSMELPRTDSLEDNARRLNDRLIQEGIRTDTLILTFPQHKAIVKTCVLPSMKESEIRAMILLQAAQTWPLGMDEIIVDYQLLETLPEGQSRVAMVIVRQEDLREELAIFNAAQRYPSRLILDSLAVLPLIRGQDLKDEPCLVIEFCGECLTLGLFNGLLLCASRSIVLPPGSSLDDATGWTRVLRDEIQRTLLSAPFPLSQDPFPMKIAGDEPHLRRAEPLIPLVWPGPVIVVRPAERAAFLEDAAAMAHSPCWPALAGSLIEAGNTSTINLLSDVEQRRGTRDVRRRARLVTLTMALFFFTIGAGTMLWQFHAKKMARDILLRQCAEINAQTLDLQRMNRMIELVQGRMSQEGSFLNLVSELNRRLPAHVSIRSLDYVAGEALSLQGNCFSLSDAVHLVEELQRSPLFPAVEMRSSNVQRIGSRDVVDFSLVCRLPPVKEKNRRPHADA